MGSKNNESLVRIDLKRCPCIHSLAQLVDVTLQSLLYQRKMIPEPASTLLHGCAPMADQFRTTYQKVQQILRNTFRTANGDGRIREFVILVGATPFSPKEIYRVRVPPTICRPPVADGNEQKNGEKPVAPVTPEGRRTAKMNGSCDADGDNNGGAETGAPVGGGEMVATKCACGGATVCDALNAKERRLVFSAVALSKTAVTHFEGCKVPGKMEKVFMFIRTKGLLADCANAEGLEEDDSFEMPDRKMKQRRKIRQLRIQVNAPCIVQQQLQQQTTEQPQQQPQQRSGGGQQRRRSHHKSWATKAKEAGERRTTTTTEENDENVMMMVVVAHDDDNGTAAAMAPADEYDEAEEVEAEEAQEEEEMASSTWYRLCPFFTNLS